jgi:hypothetical protein
MSLPRLPPRGNPTPTATATTEMSYAQRQQARAALSALTPTAGQTLSAFTDTWITAMRECGFDSREVAAAKAVLVRLVDLGAEFPSAAAVAKPVAAVAPTATPTPVETRRDPHAPVVIETELHPSDDDLDPDYSAHTAEPEPAPDPYDDEPDDDVREPPHLTAPEPTVHVQTAPAPTAAAHRSPAAQPSPPISSSRSRPYANIQPVQLPASSGPPRARNYKLPGT